MKHNFKALTTQELKNILKTERLPEQFEEVIIEMLSNNNSGNLTFYGYFTQYINFYEVLGLNTCGVNVTLKGMNFYYDPEWIKTKSKFEIYFTIIHEEMHLLFDHQKRNKAMNKKIANLAEDMIINSIIHSELIINEKLNQIEIVKDKDGNNSLIFLPKEYDGIILLEPLYNWLYEKFTKWEKDNKKYIEERKKIQNNQTKLSVDKNGNITDDNGNSLGKLPNFKNQEQDNQEHNNQKNKKQEESQGEQGQGEQGQREQGQREQGQGKQGQGKQGQGEQGQGEQGQGEQGQGEQGQGNQGQGNNPFNKDIFKNYMKGKKRYGNFGKSGEGDNVNSVDMYDIESFFESVEFENNNGQTFDLHFDDDVSPDVRKQFVDMYVESMKNRGLISSNVQQMLNKLRKHPKNYIKQLKRTLNTHIIGFKKHKTITRPSRRNVEGIKGKKKYGNQIAVILDTSGSMSGEFEIALSTIFRNDVTIKLIQIDAEINNIVNIKNKRDLQKMKIEGLGGTELTPAIQYIVKDKVLSKLNLLILTDGYTDTLNFKGFKKNCLILTTGINSPIINNNKRIKQIIIDKKI